MQGNSVDIMRGNSQSLEVDWEGSLLEGVLQLCLHGAAAKCVVCQHLPGLLLVPMFDVTWPGTWLLSTCVHVNPTKGQRPGVIGSSAGPSSNMCIPRVKLTACYLAGVCGLLVPEQHAVISALGMHTLLLAIAQLPLPPPYAFLEGPTSGH